MELFLEFEHMRLDGEGKLAWVTFTRERYLNAMSNEAIMQLNRIAMALREDPDVRVVIIRGQGRAFSTGIDLKELSSEKIDMSYHHLWEPTLRIFELMEKIIVVGMHGYCLGGALQLALACDIRVSTPECRIGLPAIRESLIPGLGVWRLPRYIGLGRAKKMILGGEDISGEEALSIGLVDHLAPQDDFFTRLDEIARKYLSSCSVGTRLSKSLLNKSFDMDYDSVLQLYFELQERTQYSMDAMEAKRAYLEKREPEWR
jgi:enoyl-CoA hydratase/carnithine racemase